MTLLLRVAPFRGARPVPTVRWLCVENGCDGDSNDTGKTVVAENGDEEPGLLGLNSSPTSHWWKDLGASASPPASVL